MILRFRVYVRGHDGNRGGTPVWSAVRYRRSSWRSAGARRVGTSAWTWLEGIIAMPVLYDRSMLHEGRDFEGLEDYADALRRSRYWWLWWD